MCVVLRCITILYNKELIRDVVQPGRTLALGARGRWFKSSHLDYTHTTHTYDKSLMKTYTIQTTEYNRTTKVKDTAIYYYYPTDWDYRYPTLWIDRNRLSDITHNITSIKSN